MPTVAKGLRQRGKTTEREASAQLEQANFAFALFSLSLALYLPFHALNTNSSESISAAHLQLYITREEAPWLNLENRHEKEEAKIKRAK